MANNPNPNLISQGLVPQPPPTGGSGMVQYAPQPNGIGQPQPQQQIGGMIPTQQAQMDMSGSGIGQVLPQMQPTPQVGGDQQQSSDLQLQPLQPEIPQQQWTANALNPINDPEIMRKVRDKYDEEVEAIGNGGETKEAERSNKALSLFANIIAPSIAAFSKGGRSAAGIQLMKQAQDQIKQKKAEYSANQTAHASALKQLNDLAKIQSEDFHKQIQDNLKNITAETKKQNTVYDEKFKTSKEAAREEEAKRKQDNLNIRTDNGKKAIDNKEKLQAAQIDLANKRGTNLDAKTKTEDQDRAGKVSLTKAKAEKTNNQADVVQQYADAATQNAANNKTKAEMAANPPEKPATTSDQINLNKTVSAEQKKLNNAAKANGKPEPPIEAAEERAYRASPYIIAKQFKGLSDDQIIKKLKNYSPEFRKRMLSELEKAQ